MENIDISLGRLYIPDERDDAFPMSNVLPQEKPVRHYKYYWLEGWRGNQGRFPHCVAFAWLHWLENGSITQNHVAAPVINPKLLYDRCQKVDQWPGERYDGTSVRAGAKILMDEGYIASYHWTRSADELALAILTKAPVVVGTKWYRGMSYPDADNVMHLTGSLDGGHAYFVNGYNAKTRMFRILNSWGDEWGKRGLAYISHDDMDKLLKDHGECCLAVEIKK